MSRPRIAEVNRKIDLVELKQVFGWTIPIGAVEVLWADHPSPLHARKALNEWLDEFERICDAYSKA
jgi:hypothetical protein